MEKQLWTRDSFSQHWSDQIAIGSWFGPIFFQMKSNTFHWRWYFNLVFYWRIDLNWPFYWKVVYSIYSFIDGNINIFNGFWVLYFQPTIVHDPKFTIDDVCTRCMYVVGCTYIVHTYLAMCRHIDHLEIETLECTQMNDQYWILILLKISF